MHRIMLTSYFPISLLLVGVGMASPARAEKGGFAPSTVTGSVDDVDAFRYRRPVNKTVSFRGPVPSNRWWTGILVRDEVKSMSAFPLTFAAAVQEYPAEGEGFGIAVSFKGIGQPAGGHPVIDDHTKRTWLIETLVHAAFLVWNDQMSRGETRTRLHQAGDWHVVLETADNNGHRFTTTMASGSPLAHFNMGNGNPRLRLNSFGARIGFSSLAGEPVLAAETSAYTGDCLMVKLLHPVTQQETTWGLFAAPGTRWTRDREYLSLALAKGTDFFALALLPSASDLALFHEHAYAQIIGTRADYAFDPALSQIRTAFSFTTRLLRQDKRFSATVLTTLFPHQYKNLAPGYQADASRAYPTQRGQLRLFAGNRFETVLRHHGLLTVFNEPLGSPGYSHDQAVQWLGWEDYVKQYFGVDTYGTGQTLLRAGLALSVAASVGASRLFEEIKLGLRRELADWFEYSPGSEPTFWADQKAHHFFTQYSPADGDFGHLTGWRAAYGSQALNDLHLHYGYWIYAAALLALYDPSFVADYGWAVESLIRNIASPDRADPDFPYLRVFDPYAGRSYASGYYYFGYHNGNDLESSAEAQNAWQAIYQWGLVTGNTKLRDLGLYLFWTEKSAADQYWHDVDGDVFHPQYGYAVAGIVREGAVEWNTHWGSKHAEEIYGIQVLPVTPGTLQLGLNHAHAKRMWDELTGIHLASKGTPFDTWHGVMLELLALVDPASAVQRFRFGETAGPVGQEYSPLMFYQTWSSIYHLIHNLNLLGTPSPDYHADQPSYGVFVKGGQPTFVGFNPSPDRSLTIRFFDSRGQLVHTMGEIPPHQVVYQTRRAGRS